MGGKKAKPGNGLRRKAHRQRAQCRRHGGGWSVHEGDHRDKPERHLPGQVDQRQARNPQAAHKPRVHWFIGLSERTRDDPPVGASHTGRKEKRKTRHGPEGHVSRSRCLVSALMTVERETRISQIRHSRNPAGARPTVPHPVREAGQHVEGRGPHLHGKRPEHA